MPPRPQLLIEDHHAILDIEYDGAPFRGWTRQPGGILTIEGALIAAFQSINCTDVALCCAGRTDAGVHATAQVADVRYRGSLPPERLARALITALPDALAVTASRPAPQGFDSRADATSRAYEYRVLARSIHSPMRATRVLHHPRELDKELLDAAAGLFCGHHDFSAFTPTQTLHKYFERIVIDSRWIERGDELVFQVRANAFLRHMVRIAVGTMLAVGRGTFSLDRFARLVDDTHTAKRGDASSTAPPHGLCFVDVTWDPIDGVPLPPRWRATRPADDAGGAVHPFQIPG